MGILILDLPIQENGISFHFSESSSVSFINVLYFSAYKTFTTLVRFIPKCFIIIFLDVIFFSYSNSKWVVFFILLFILLYNIVLVLPYINMHPPWVYTCSPSWTPLPPPSPYHPSGSSQYTSPKHPVSCIEPGLVICFTYDIIHVSMPFSQIIPPSPSPTESKRLFYMYICVSLLSRIQDYHYHLSKFHIFVWVYCIGVFFFLAYFTLYNRVLF